MKFNVAIIIGLFLSLSLFSQEQKKLAFGVKGGVNLSSDNLVYSYSFGYQIGAFGKINLNNNFIIIPEIFFSSLRATSDLVCEDENGNLFGVDGVYDY